MADPQGFLKHTKRELPARRPVPLRLLDWKEVYEDKFSHETLQTQASRCNSHTSDLRMQAGGRLPLLIVIGSPTPGVQVPAASACSPYPIPPARLRCLLLTRGAAQPRLLFRRVRIRPRVS